MTTTVYQTDAQGVLVRPLTLDDSDRDPLSPGDYLIPGDCVIDTPPDIPAGHAAVYSSGGWAVVEDHRGRVGYIDGTPARVGVLGPLPDGWSDTAPPQTAADLWAALRAERDRRLTASDIMVLPDRWDAYTPEQRAAWTAYRQSLRDLPEATANPVRPAWPEVPEALT